VLTWNYYGLWQIEQGNREQAEYHLSRIAAICGTDLRGISVFGGGRWKNRPAQALSIEYSRNAVSASVSAALGTMSELWPLSDIQTFLKVQKTSGRSLLLIQVDIGRHLYPVLV